MQINTVHLALLEKVGISRDDLFQPRINIFIGAWVLKRCFKKHSFSKNAITCYNGRIKDNPYANKVLNTFFKAEKKYASN